MAVASLLLSYIAVSMVSACVPPTCNFVTHRPDARWGKRRHSLSRDLDNHPPDPTQPVLYFDPIRPTAIGINNSSVSKRYDIIHENCTKSSMLLLGRITAIATDGVAWSVCLWVCLSVCWLRSRTLHTRLNRSIIRLTFWDCLTCTQGTTYYIGVEVGQIHSLPRGVTTWRCGPLLQFFDHLLYIRYSTIKKIQFSHTRWFFVFCVIFGIK